jgi:hypothetical protein
VTTGFTRSSDDGYRTIIVVDDGKAQAFTRNGNDWTDGYPGIIAAAERLRCRSAIIDGEVIVQREDGCSDFEATRRSGPSSRALPRLAAAAVSLALAAAFFSRFAGLLHYRRCGCLFASLTSHTGFTLTLAVRLAAIGVLGDYLAFASNVPTRWLPAPGGLHARATGT